MRKGCLSALTGIIGVVAGVVGTGIFYKGEIETKDKKIYRLKSYYSLLNQWLIVKNEDKHLSTFFKDKGYYNIAIYGMGELGNRLIDELKTSEIKVVFAIDKNASSVYSEIDVLNSDEDIPDVDVIVVTAVFAFDEIEKDLSEKTSIPIVSLEDVVFEV